MGSDLHLDAVRRSDDDGFTGLYVQANQLPVGRLVRWRSLRYPIPEGLVFFRADREATAAGMGNPLAIAASTGLFVGDRIYNNISDNMQNTIGSGVNSLVRGTGKIFGQDWGVDPQQAAGGSGQPSAAGKPGSAVIPTSPDGGIPLGPQNSLRALENRIPMLRNGEVAKGDRKTVPLPPNYEPGAEKVDGVYGKDIGGGIKKFDRPGQSPLYTNMEGPGAGFENRREVTPQNAAAMNALAGRYENQQRQAAQAQLAREQAGPGPQVSIMNSGMRGNMRINDNGDKGQSIADMVKTLKSNGIKVSHNTLRTMLANQGQREAAQIQANASMYGHDSSSRTQLATNANTVNAQREGNQLQNQASMHGHNVSASGNRLRAQIDGMKFQADQHWKGLENQRAGETHASAQAKGRADNASSLLESLAVVDGKDGKKFNEGQHKQNMAIANSAVPGFANMTREEQQQHMPTVLGAIQVIQGANANKEDTWGKKLGWTPVAPDRTTMPNFKPGTQLQRDGMVDAMGPSAMHDFRAGGVPLGQNLDANAIEALKRAGVNVGIKGAY